LKKLITYGLGLFVIAVAVMSCGKRKPTIPSLYKTYSKEDALPFGEKVAYQLVQQAYAGNDIISLGDENRLSYFSYDDTNFLYMCVAKNVYATKQDAASILNYASEGNTFFIAAENISDELLDTLGVGQLDAEYFYGQFLDYNIPVYTEMKDTHVNMSTYAVSDTTHYGYFFLPLQNSFSKFDSASTRVLGLNEDGNPDFIVVFYGKGRIFLHCSPAAFSNYFLLQHDNYKYLQDVLSLLPASPEHVYWDDYYYKHNYPKASGSGLSVLFRYPAMKWAFWLTVILLLLYIIFGGKRRQRIIPVLSPMKNTTVAYTETISRLYLQKKDNKNIADKMITYFFEYIRNQFFLNTNMINEDFVETLSHKSAVPLEITEPLFKTITSIQQQTAISDQQVLLLNKQIENFFKNKK
jgi:hypothetical protein